MRKIESGLRWKIVGTGLALTLGASVGFSGATVAAAPRTPKLIIGVIHVGSTKDAGYNQAEQAGISYLQSHMTGVKVIMAQEVSEGTQVNNVMKSMISQGAKLIFPMDFGYQSTAYALAAAHKNVVFEQPGGYMVASNFGDYWGNSDDINYTLGVAAAKMSKSHKIGFVGAMPIPTILCSAIAFHLGAQSVSKSITTRVIWTDSWSDPAKEAAAVNTLHAAGVDVVATLVDSPITVVKTAAKDKMWVIGYHSTAGQSYATSAGLNWWLSSVAFNWGPMFVSMAKDVENGTWGKSAYDSIYIAPISSGVAYMAPFGPRVLTVAKNAAIAALKLFTSRPPALVNPYKGPIYDQNNVLKVKAGQYLSQSDQNYVNWLAKGMIGSTK